MIFYLRKSYVTILKLFLILNDRYNKIELNKLIINFRSLFQTSSIIHLILFPLLTLIVLFLKSPLEHL